MSVRVRLTRVGNKKNPIWRVVVADQRSPRDGRSIETLGHYNPQTQPSTIVIDRERMDYWLERGARPSGNGEEAAARAEHRGRGPTGAREEATPVAEQPGRGPGGCSCCGLRRGPGRHEAASREPEAPSSETRPPIPRLRPSDAPAEPETADTGAEPDPEAPSTESA